VHINLCPSITIPFQVSPKAVLPCNLLLGKGPFGAGVAEFDPDQKQIILFGRQHCGVKYFMHYMHTGI
jgi:hypothetical protein